MVQTAIEKRSNINPWPFMESSWVSSRDGNREEYAEELITPRLIAHPVRDPWVSFESWYVGSTDGNREESVGELMTPRLVAHVDFEKSNKFVQQSGIPGISVSEFSTAIFTDEIIVHVQIPNLRWRRTLFEKPIELILSNTQSMIITHQPINPIVFTKNYHVYFADTGIESEDPLDIGRQLTDMKRLKFGWADGLQSVKDWGEGYGNAPTSEGLEWLEGQFDAHYSGALPRPYLYPTPEGGVQAEWSIDQNEASLEVDLFRHSAEWHCLNLRTGYSTEVVLNLDDDHNWERLVAKIRQLGLMDE